MALQPRGAWIAASGFGLLLAGLWRIDGPLAALGLAAFCLLALAALTGRRNLHGLKVSVDAPSRVTARVSFPLRISVTKRSGWLDAFGVELAIELPGPRQVGARVSWLAAGSAADLEVRASAEVRAAVDGHPVRLVSRFPLGLWEFRARDVVPAPLVVFPRPVFPRALVPSGVLLDASPMEGASAGDADGEVRGLRPWRAGDHPRRIHWPVSLRSIASGAGPLVREVDPPGFHPRSCLVLFHSFGIDGGLIRPDRFERALSLAAGTLRHLHGIGIPARFAADFDGWQERTVSTRPQLSSCFERMARAVRAAGTEAHDLQAAAAKAGDEESLVVISDMPVRAWRHTLPKRNLAAVALEPVAVRSTKPAKR